MEIEAIRKKWDQRYSDKSKKYVSKPTIFVQECLAHIPSSGRALDIAAGSGRHALALAQKGLVVDAIDISGVGLALIKQQAQAHRFSQEQIRCIQGDLERNWLPKQTYDVILVSFFLHRPLFQLLPHHLNKHGFLIYETFVVNPTHQADSNINPQFQLQPKELATKFSNLKILSYHEGVKQSRYTARLLAQKA